MTITNVDGSVPEGASLNDLLSLGTYQGMSDAQIERVIEWKVSMARQEAQTRTRAECEDGQMKAIRAQLGALAESTGAVLDRALASQPMFITTPGGQPEVVNGA